MEANHLRALRLVRQLALLQVTDPTLALQEDEVKVVQVATRRTSRDLRRPTDAVFVHGSCVRDLSMDKELLAVAAGLVHTGAVKHLVINGISDEVCETKTLAYPGAETWVRLLEDLDVQDVLQIPPSPHTPAEVRNVIALANERGWRTLTIMALPHHLLRVAAQWVYLLEQAGSSITVYFRSFEGFNFDLAAKKPVLGGGVVEGILADHVDHELNQQQSYSDKSGMKADGSKFTPNATLPEVVAYLSRRDGVDYMSMSMRQIDEMS